MVGFYGKCSIYGLSEIFYSNIKKNNIIACPGCYPTSLLLPLIPLLDENLINTQEIIADCKSGYSGAGRGILKKSKETRQPLDLDLPERKVELFKNGKVKNGPPIISFD